MTALRHRLAEALLRRGLMLRDGACVPAGARVTLRSLPGEPERLALHLDGAPAEAALQLDATSLAAAIDELLAPAAPLREERFFAGAGDAAFADRCAAALRKSPLLIDGARTRLSRSTVALDPHRLSGEVVALAVCVSYRPTALREPTAAARAALHGGRWPNLRALPDDLPLDLFLALEAVAEDTLLDAEDLRARLAAPDEPLWCLIGLAACLDPRAYARLLEGCADHRELAVRSHVAREAMRLGLEQTLRRAVRAGIDVPTLGELLDG